MRILIPHSDLHLPKTWRLVGRYVEITCAECGKSYVIQHDVKRDGSVAPSLLCPTPDCPWHVHAKLDGWSGRAREGILDE